MVGLKTTEVVPPPEKVPNIIPVFFPVITILEAFRVEVLTGLSKVNVISESKDTVFNAVAGVEEVSANSKRSSTVIVNAFSYVPDPSDV